MLPLRNQTLDGHLLEIQSHYSSKHNYKGFKKQIFVTLFKLILKINFLHMFLQRAIKANYQNGNQEAIVLLLTYVIKIILCYLIQHYNNFNIIQPRLLYMADSHIQYNNLHKFRDSFNLSQFMDYYNTSNPNNIFVKDSLNINRSSKKQLVMLRIRKHASDIRLQRAGKTNVQNKLLEIIRSKSVAKDILDGEQLNYPFKKEKIPKCNSFNQTPRNHAHKVMPIKDKCKNNKRTPTVDGKRLGLNQFINVDSSLPRLPIKKSEHQEGRYKQNGIKLVRKYQKKADFSIIDITPWVHQDSIQC